MSTISPTRHFLRLFSRYCRSRATEREAPERPLLNSSSHCFDMIPRNAGPRLRTRPENHKPFSRTAEAWLIQRLPVCEEFCWEGSDWSRMYDCTLNAVRIAENRPALKIVV